ncbi:MAG: elongation factor G [Candidatus Hodgkinia cicadicola]
MNLRNIRNFGIMAHIDAGKTTFTERLLFYTGKLHCTGEVHNGTAVMDWMTQEQERGITITSAATSTRWNSPIIGEAYFNIIDTPGHVDFTAEVERSLRVLDGAIIVLDASAGVEPQTEMIWRQANKYMIPRIVFCNKMDKLGSDYFASANSLSSKLSAKPLLLQIPIGHDVSFCGVIDLVKMTALYWNVDDKGIKWSCSDIPQNLREFANKQREDLINNIVELEQKALNDYLNNKPIEANYLISLIRLATISGKVFPVLCGSAFKNKAIQPALDAIINYLPSPDEVLPVEDVSNRDTQSQNHQVLRFPSCLEPLSMLVFKIVSDVYLGSLSYVRIYSGVVNNGDVIINSRNGQKEKVVKILKMHANYRTELKMVSSGDIVAIAGFKTVITGDTLCSMNHSISLNSIDFPAPVIQIALEPQTKVDQEKIVSILDKFILEDPTLSFNIDVESGQIILSGMGELHLDIVIDRIYREYNLVVKKGKPQVAYRETIVCKCVEEYVHKKQTGGAGQFAKVKILFEPNDKDEFVFVSKIVGGAIPKEFIPSIKKGLESIISSGLALGYPMIRIKATLIDGAFHSVDSSALAFEIAAKQCFRQAILNVGARILEPIMRVEVCVPDEYIGNIICDLSARKGHILDQISSIGYTTLIANVPLANMFKYIDTVRSLSKGRGNYFMRFNNYSELNSVI